MLDAPRNPPGANPLEIQCEIMDSFAIILLGRIRWTGNDLKSYIEIYKGTEAQARKIFF